MNKLSIVIPAYNEEQRIEHTLRDVAEFLKTQNFNYEILVVNDGSKDNTAEVVRNLEQSIPKLRLVDNKENHGKGWVTKQGMLEAAGDVRLFMDADNSTKVEEILKMLPLFEQGYDIVIGSRRIVGSKIAVHQPWIRDFQGSVFRLIVHTLVPLGVTDSQCGFKAFSAKASQSVFPLQRIYRWAFDVEILALARKMKFNIKEVPVTWVNDADSHVKFSGKVHMLLEVLEIRWNLWTGKYKILKKTDNPSEESVQTDRIKERA
ncbi:MAG: glycosyltransferase family 2 protein [Patescibacteria group bacterium]|nr:glycosyltransferase family 2 protein [Patescibacteria group bacterium]